MTDPARRVRHRGLGAYRDDAEELLSEPGDTATVFRGRARSLVMKCPDGCGETLVINLDPRAGKAWKIDDRGGATTLFPSVWRENGCESHFIVWRDRILWCDRFYEDNVEPPYDAGLAERVLQHLDDRSFKNAIEVADHMGEIPWEVLHCCRKLASAGRVEEGQGPLKQHFRRL
ncbi:DUF6527 family protein [Tardiphaga sp. OK245]|uniref:DUF6527 family protein n=1 Tax=Tardiphaga sp. OK245 TaxID=1855306 RepID=UPI0008A77166|nr:DUF6527 family protein [Tardiphaga sp. OK245]SEH87286.1 hypothetical protein SAMN05216367_2465 [Tardiphaga sp. OK245]